MELDGALSLAVMRPVAESRAEGDDAGIQQHDAGGFDALNSVISLPFRKILGTDVILIPIQAKGSS